MKKEVDVSKEINEMRKLPANKKCFECGEIGTTYIVQDFGVFACSGCAGIHREFSHRVKGLSMSNFTNNELETLKTQGNEVGLRTWMARYNPRDFPQPGPKDTRRIKDFIRLKYKERRWYQELTSETQAVSPPTQVQVSTPQVLIAPVPPAAVPVVPAVRNQPQDLLSLGDSKPQDPADSEGWAEFQSANHVSEEVYQPPQREEVKQPEPVYFPVQPVYPSEPIRPTVNPVILQQQYQVQSRTYVQLFGHSYPYDYTTWYQIAYPRPPM